MKKHTTKTGTSTSLIKKAIFASPFILLAALVGLIAWANLSPVESEAADEYSKDNVDVSEGKEYIETAWQNWNYDGNSGFENLEYRANGTDMGYKNNVTFIAIKSIEEKQQEALGLSDEIAEMQKIIGLLDGNPAALSEMERQDYVNVFNEKLEAAYNSIK
ncbi:hypothetical protein QOZ98_000007 [Planomicrobium stackebrandtii]|uniref:Uncharacterized protein n=1 Tax=Planomicrobium stackebrandtii TaxID=253160 RepID=A0ABU0GPC2_9BACL|nr:hypothetical protein [Planomicrobium stackebrandtii]MDQ0427182.1 hypothetical protein [Planomicrobium stackebrandtii]